ncbi:transposase-like protein [Fusarium oxysporum f. sp. phaseoli]
MGIGKHVLLYRNTEDHLDLPTGAFCYQTYRIGTPNAEVDAKIFPHTRSYKLLKAPGNGRLWEVMTGMKYLLGHLEDRKLFYHAVPDEATEENTHSQVELARGRPNRNRQIPARFRDCEIAIHPRKSMQSSLPGRGSGQCDDGSGKPSGSSEVDDMKKDLRRYLRLPIITAWQKLNEYYTNLGESPLFAASTILHPSLGKSYLEVNRALGEQLVWARDAKDGLSDYLDR